MPDDSYYRQIMYVRDGGIGERFMVLGTVTDLAREMKDAEYADYEVAEVFGLDQLGEVQALLGQVRGAADFDDGDFAHPVVTVFFPDGHRDECLYRVDGRS